MTIIKTLLDLLSLYGGEIVCTATLDVNDINQAKASERMYVDDNGIGFVWMPKLERMPQTVEEVEFFEKWWPLDVEMPEELKNPEWLFKALDVKSDTARRYRQEKEWIKCSERLPISSWYYLVIKNNIVVPMWFMPTIGWVDVNPSFIHDEKLNPVTHWKQLDEPPIDK